MSWYSEQDETFADYLYRLRRAEEDAAWSALLAELAELAEMREPEDGEDLPKRSGMGRRRI